MSPPASRQPRARGAKRRGAGYRAPLLAPREPHAHHLWASSADLGPHPFAAELTPGASCQLGHGLHPCPHHSLHPAGHPGPYSQTQTPSGTLHLPTPSPGALRTAGRRPKTWVPRPHGLQRQGPEWVRLLPTLQLLLRSHCYTGIKAGQASLAVLVSPRDPAPFGGQEHYTAQEAFTLDGGPAPHTPAMCGSPDLPAPLGPDTVPSWLGGPEPVSGNCPEGWCREEGRCRGEGPALAVTSTFDQVLPLPQGLVSGPPCPGGHLGPGLSGCLPAAPARVGALALGSNEAK